MSFEKGNKQDFNPQKCIIDESGYPVPIDPEQRQICQMARSRVDGFIDDIDEFPECGIATGLNIKWAANGVQEHCIDYCKFDINNF